MRFDAFLASPNCYIPPRYSPAVFSRVSDPTFRRESFNPGKIDRIDRRGGSRGIRRSHLMNLGALNFRTVFAVRGSFE